MTGPVIAKRVRSLSRTALLRVDAVQDEQGRIQVLLRLRSFVTDESATSETTIPVPPNRLFDVAEALTGLARELGVRR